MFVCLFWFFSHMTVSGCDRELNAHFYSAASLKYHVLDTCHDARSGHSTEYRGGLTEMWNNLRQSLWLPWPSGLQRCWLLISLSAPAHQPHWGCVWVPGCLSERAHQHHWGCVWVPGCLSARAHQLHWGWVWESHVHTWICWGWPGCLSKRSSALVPLTCLSQNVRNDFEGP